MGGDLEIVKVAGSLRVDCAPAGELGLLIKTV